MAACGGSGADGRADRACCLLLSLLFLQVTKYVEREIINHRQLVHPHIVQFKEVRAEADEALASSGTSTRRAGQ